MSNHETVSVSACGKCILVGEHAVVYGTAAIAMPLPSMRVSITLRKRDAIAVDARDRIPVDFRERTAGVVVQACKLLNVAPPEVTIEGSSALPVGAGLGSSAALCVATLRALAAYYRRHMTAGELAQFANVLEQQFHGNPSGLDATVVAYETFLRFRRGEAPVILQLPDTAPALHFVLVDSRQRSSTKDMVERASSGFKGELGNLRLQRFEALTMAAAEVLMRRDEANLASIMSECAGLLTELGVVTPTMLEVAAAMAASGVKGVKPTGAGGGGMILGLVPSQHADVVWHQLVSKVGAENCYRTVI